MPTVINKYTSTQKGTVNIMRGNPLGNPFRIGRDGSRKEVVEKFENYARKSFAVLDAISRLKEDDVLICCCKPHACHGDVIDRIWHELKELESLPPWDAAPEAE